MQAFTIEFFNIDYTNNDFCGVVLEWSDWEILPSIASQIIASQPQIVKVTFSLTDEEVQDFFFGGESDNDIIDCIVNDFWPEDVLYPGSFSYSFIDCKHRQGVFHKF